MPVVGLSTPGAPKPYSPLVRASQFPLILSTGAIARYPLARQRRYATKQVDFADYSRQTASLLSNPLMQWDVTLSELTDQETAALSQFFDLQKASAGTFTFLDPWENLLQQSENFELSPWVLNGGILVGQNYLTNSQDFEQTSWVGTNTGASNPVVTPDAQIAPDGTTTADTIAFPLIPNTSGDFSQLAESTSPPTLANMTFTFSVWLRVASGTGNVNIQVNDITTTSNTQPCALTASWQRFSVTMTLGSSPGTFVQGAIINPQNAPAITVWAWGAQIEYGAAPSDYTPTTTTPLPLAIADPFFLPAPSAFAGSQWNLNSAYPKRGRQIVVTSTSAGAVLTQLVAASPAGLNLTASLYLKQQAASSLAVGPAVRDAAFNEAFSPANIPLTSAWVRSSFSGSFSNSNPSASFGLSIGSNLQRGTFYIFGAQLETEGVASAYKYTQTVGGVHPKCYIMSDEYAHIASEFDVNVFENSMRQRRSTLSSLSDVLTICESN